MADRTVPITLHSTLNPDAIMALKTSKPKGKGKQKASPPPPIILSCGPPPACAPPLPPPSPPPSPPHPPPRRRSMESDELGAEIAAANIRMPPHTRQMPFSPPARMSSLPTEDTITPPPTTVRSPQPQPRRRSAPGTTGTETLNRLDWQAIASTAPRTATAGRKKAKPPPPPPPTESAYLEEMASAIGLESAPVALKDVDAEIQDHMIRLAELKAYRDMIAAQKSAATARKLVAEKNMRGQDTAPEDVSEFEKWRALTRDTREGSANSLGSLQSQQSYISLRSSEGSVCSGNEDSFEYEDALAVSPSPTALGVSPPKWTGDASLTSRPVAPPRRSRGRRSRKLNAIAESGNDGNAVASSRSESIGDEEDDANGPLYESIDDVADSMAALNHQGDQLARSSSLEAEDDGETFVLREDLLQDRRRVTWGADDLKPARALARNRAFKTPGDVRSPETTRAKKTTTEVAAPRPVSRIRSNSLGAAFGRRRKKDRDEEPTYQYAS